MSQFHWLLYKLLITCLTAPRSCIWDHPGIICFYRGSLASTLCYLIYYIPICFICFFMFLLFDKDSEFIKSCSTLFFSSIDKKIYLCESLLLKFLIHFSNNYLLEPSLPLTSSDKYNFGHGLYYSFYASLQATWFLERNWKSYHDLFGKPVWAFENDLYLSNPLLKSV